MICTLALVVYSLTSLFLCLYIGRIQASFPPISLCARLLSFLHLPFLIGTLGLSATCGLDAWGAVLVGLWLAASCVDLCLRRGWGDGAQFSPSGTRPGVLRRRGPAGSSWPPSNPLVA